MSGMTYAPKRGSLIMVNFSMGGKPVGAEMPKDTRPCVVVQRQQDMKRGQLVTVVPLSTVEPRKIMPFHHLMDHRSFRQMPESFDRARPRWAKCDYITTISLDRCKSPYRVPGYGRKRQPLKVQIIDADLGAIDDCLRWALALDQ